MAFRTQRDFKILLFRIEGKRFAVDISEVKKVIKEKGGNMEITEIEGAPPYIIGISEIEIVQNQKDLITFIDFRKIIDIEKIESGDNNMPQGAEDEKTSVKEKEEDKNSQKAKDKRQQFDTESSGDINYPTRPAKRRIFMIISNLEKKEKEAEEKKTEEEGQQTEQKKPKYIGILIDQVERIEEVRENENATLYPPPDIKGLKDFFREIVVFNDEEIKEGERRILVLNTQKFFEYIS